MKAFDIIHDRDGDGDDGFRDLHIVTLHSMKQMEPMIMTNPTLTLSHPFDAHVGWISR